MPPAKTDKTRVGFLPRGPGARVPALRVLAQIPAGGIRRTRLHRGKLTGEPATEPSATPPDALHKVMVGDNLHMVAGNYDGEVGQRETIRQVKRDQVPNPDQIGRGTRLRVPGAGLPEETYTDCLSFARRIVTPASSPAGSKVGRSREVAIQTSRKMTRAPETRRLK